MNYKCIDCGHIFEDGEERIIREKVGEFWGIPAYQECSVCPHCGGDYMEAKRCSICGSVHLVDELLDGICSDCVNDLKIKYKYDIRGCYNVSDKNLDKNDVSINGFLACMFTEEQINEILLKELVSASAFSPIDCTPFIESDEGWFISKIAKEVDNDENGKK